MILAALLICLFLSMPVLAATVDPIYQLIYSISPSTAQFFKPVKKSDVDQGIKLEVHSAYIHENTAEIYITMQDLSGDRIDSTMDLNDSESINLPFDSSATCERVSYDDATRTATFRIQTELWENQKIEGKKITFTVREFLSRGKTDKDLEIPINLSTIQTTAKTNNVEVTGGSNYDAETATALIPSAPRKELAVKGIELTGIGYVDNKLHVQTAVENLLENDNHSFIRLKDERGKVINSDYSFGFENEEKASVPISYTEHVFDIPKDEISKYRLCGDFTTSGMRTEGDWSVTFPLRNDTDKK